MSASLSELAADAKRAKAAYDDCQSLLTNDTLRSLLESVTSGTFDPDESGHSFARNWFKDLKRQLDRSSIPLDSRVRYFNDSLQRQPLQDLLERLYERQRDLPCTFLEKVFELSDKGEIKGRRQFVEATAKHMQNADKFLDHVRSHGIAEVSLLCLFLCYMALGTSEPPAGRQSDDRATENPPANFTRAFHGPALTLLVDHIVVHNGLFDVEQPKQAAAQSDDQQPPPSKKLKQDPDVGGASSAAMPKPYYSKVLPFIQSSGFGKTRACVQLSTVAPGMLICLRETSRQDKLSQRVSFPPQDASVFKYFRNIQASLPPQVLPPFESEDFKKAHLGVLIWLAVYAETMARYICDLKRFSDCFEKTPDQGSSKAHSSAKKKKTGPPRNVKCWKRIVHYLALAIHSADAGFAPQDLFPPPDSLDLCHHTRLEDHAQKSATVNDNFDPHVRPVIFCTKDFRQRMLKYMTTRALDVFNDYTGCPTAGGNVETTRPDEHLADDNFDVASTCTEAKTTCTLKLKTDDFISEAVSKILMPALNSLEASCPLSPRDPSRTFFFLALDECTSINRLLPAIRRVWSYARPGSTWILLIDTNSELAPLTGTVARLASHRTQDGQSHILTQPFCTMPLDVNFDEAYRRKLFSLPGPDETGSDMAAETQDFITLRTLNQWLHMLGRPLWNDSYYRRRELLLPKNIISKLVHPADFEWRIVAGDTMEKKAKQSVESSGEPEFDDLHQNLLALASRRLLLELTQTSGTTLWHNFVNTQIKEHLRFVGRIFNSTDSIITTTPSEPPLSAAAAYFFRQAPQLTASKWSMIVRSLIIASTHVGFNIGAEGEVGVALLSSLAIDLAASERYHTQLQAYSRSPATVDRDEAYDAIFGLVTVREWLRTMIGDTDWPCFEPVGRQSKYEGQAMDLDSDDRKDPSPMLAWVDRAWLNFNHIVTLDRKIAHDKSLDLDILVELWFRHAALVGVVNQDAWDLLIPVYESKPVGEDASPPKDEQFDKNRLTYIAIQVKNRANKASEAELAKRVGPLLPARPAPGIPGFPMKRECLEMFFDLRSQIPDPPEPEARENDDGPDMIRYNFYVNGLTTQSLPVIKQLVSPEDELVLLLFGKADSVDAVKFDQTLAGHMRKHKDQSAKKAWGEVETRIKGALVVLK